MRLILRGVREAHPSCVCIPYRRDMSLGHTKRWYYEHYKHMVGKGKYSQHDEDVCLESEVNRTILVLP